MTEVAVGSLVVVGLVLLLAAGLLGARQRLTPKGTVAVTVNGSTVIETPRGRTLLNVLHGADIPVPSPCGGKGSCGMCRVTATGEGAGEPLATERGMLSAAERRAHRRLACQVSVRGPVEVGVPDEILTAETFDCTVVSNRMLAPLIRELVLQPPAGQRIDFRAGAFMQLTAPAYALDFREIAVPEQFRQAWRIAGWQGLRAGTDQPVTRAYSIANRPEDAGRLVFDIRLAVPPAGREADIPPGIVSSWLFALEPGATVGASGPFGEFRVQDTGREMVLIGGGVGMAPLRAMIHEQLGKGTGRKMSYFYGARTAADLFYTAEFDALAAANPNFTWTPALSDPAPGDRWTGETGFIHETVRKVLSRHPAPEDCEYYLCGPPVMISAVYAMLERLGVERSSIFNDDFGG